MKNFLLVVAAACMSFAIGCSGSAPTLTPVDEQKVNALRKTKTSKVSPARTLEVLAPKERAEKIREWTKNGVAKQFFGPAIGAYVNDPDPDVAAAAKEYMEAPAAPPK